MGVRETIGRGISRAFGGSSRQSGRDAVQQYRAASAAAEQAHEAAIARARARGLKPGSNEMDAFVQQDPEYRAAVEQFQAARQAATSRPDRYKGAVGKQFGVPSDIAEEMAAKRRNDELLDAMMGRGAGIGVGLGAGAGIMSERRARKMQ